jgi:hypothetical protein
METNTADRLRICIVHILQQWNGSKPATILIPALIQQDTDSSSNNSIDTKNLVYQGVTYFKSLSPSEQSHLTTS